MLRAIGSSLASRPMFESLENRLLMASGSVAASVVDGSLILTGGAGHDHVVIDQLGLASDQFRIHGTNDDTEVNGLHEVIVSGVIHDIRASFGNGSNHLQLDECEVPGDIIYDGGDFFDNLRLSGHVAGSIVLSSSNSWQAELYMQSLSVDGDVTCDGPSRITMIESSTGQLQFRSDTTAWLIMEQGSSIHGEVSITAIAAGVLLTGSTIDGDVQIDGTPDGVALTVRDGSTIGGVVTVLEHSPEQIASYGSGTVDILVRDSTLGGLTVRLRGGIVPSFGASIPEAPPPPPYEVGNIMLQDAEILGNVDIQTDAGYEDVILSGCVFSGDVQVDTGDSFDTITAENCQFLGSQWMTLGDGQDVPRPGGDGPIGTDPPIEFALYLRAARVAGGRLVIHGGGGNEHFRVTAGLNGGEFRVELIEFLSPDQPGGEPGGLVPTVHVIASALLEGITKGIRADLGAGNDVLEINGCTMPGDVVVQGGAGDDSCVLDSTQVGGRLVFSGGSGHDYLQLTDGSAVAGLVRVHDTRGENDISLAQSSTGALRVYAAGRTSLSMSGAAVGGVVNLITGRYDDEIHIEDSTFAADVRMRMQGGDDLLSIDSLMDIFPAEYSLRVNLGLGNDTLDVEQSIPSDSVQGPPGIRTVRRINGSRGRDAVNLPAVEDVQNIRHSLKSFDNTPASFAGLRVGWFGGLWPHSGHMTISPDGSFTNDGEQGQLDPARFADLLDALWKAGIDSDRAYGPGNVSDGYSYSLKVNGFTLKFEDGSDLPPAIERLVEIVLIGWI